MTSVQALDQAVWLTREYKEGGLEGEGWSLQTDCTWDKRARVYLDQGLWNCFNNASIQHPIHTLKYNIKKIFLLIKL